MANDKIILYMEREEADGTYVDEIELPTHMEVCDRCRGKGTHTNPSIDGNGLSQEYAEDVEFMEDYLSGAYDVRCEECNGANVVPVVDEERMTPEQVEAWHTQCQEEWEYQAERDAERRMGC